MKWLSPAPSSPARSSRCEREVRSCVIKSWEVLSSDGPMNSKCCPLPDVKANRLSSLRLMNGKGRSCHLPGSTRCASFTGFSNQPALITLFLKRGGRSSSESGNISDYDCAPPEVNHRYSLQDRRSSLHISGRSSLLQFLLASSLNSC